MAQANVSDWTASIVVVLAVLFMCVMPIVLMYHRIAHNRPVATVRMIQLLALVMIIPSIVIFGMSGKLESSTIGTLLAALAGMFSGIANDAITNKKPRPPATGAGNAGSEDTSDDI